jgi:hypothetical protein
VSAYLWTSDVTDLMVPTTPQPDQAVAPNFERFDGLEGSPPLDHPAAVDDGSGRPGANYGTTPRPGQRDQPVGQVYTPGPLAGVVGVVGGQPLPVRSWSSSEDSALTRGYTPSKAPSVQWRLGVGQDNQGVAQTVILSEITSNPPVPGDLTSILAGQA